MKNILLILVLLISGYAIGQTSTPIKTNYDFKKGFKVTGGNAVVPIATGDTYAVPFKQMQDTTAKYLQKKDTLSIDSIPKYDQLLVALQAIGSSIKAKPLFSDINSGNSTYTLGDGIAMFSMCYIEKSCTITGVKFLQSTQGNFTGDQFNGIALYKLVGTTLVKVAETANDANIWKATSATIQTAAFATPYSAYAGVYYIAHVYNSSAQTTAPIIQASLSISSVLSGSLSGNNNKIVFYVTPMNSFPATQANSVGTASTPILNTWLY